MTEIKKGAGSLLSQKHKIDGKATQNDSTKASYRPLGQAPTMVS
jgi:hypothetical protein